MRIRITLAATLALACAATAFAAPRHEIMIAFDRSGSLAGAALTEEKAAATLFVQDFAATQGNDRIGLVSFATGVRVEQPLDTATVSRIATGITGLTASGASNLEDAFAQAGGPLGLTDVSGLAPDERPLQYLVFFTDGGPTAFRSTFLNADVRRDAVALVTGVCDGSGSGSIDNLYDPVTGARTAIRPVPTGDGKATGSACGTASTTRWDIFDTYPVVGYAPETCSIPQADLAPYACQMAAKLALDRAQALKDRGVVIYVIGFEVASGSVLLRSLASGLDHYYQFPPPSDIHSIAQAILGDAVPVQRHSWGSLKLLYR